ncbi:hypothetical protein M422DRAFT_262243 [Sphaerobolus stellatus SS14]|uniref:Uncharacterized protein n=1 Tax=Sphaerobolus stellatus (strain SS14) TaxID=990650 RepID=A0A0C9VD44_SPHS4|nr:hypothetical protein M422DRAFT_262243 [Sphaerobolus stellatus SS14]
MNIWNEPFIPMVPQKKTSDKVPAGTGDAIDSGSTTNVAGGNDPTLDPGRDPSQVVSAISEMSTIHPTTQSTHVNNQLAQLASEWELSENPTQTPKPHGGSGDPLLPKTYSDYSEPKMLDTINEHMDEAKAIHNMSCQVAQLLVKTNESNSALEARTRAFWLNNHVNEEFMTDQPNVGPQLMQSTPRPNNRSGTKHVLSKAQTKLSVKAAILEQLYVDQVSADHLTQAATAVRNTHMEYGQILRLSKAGLLNLQD